METSNRRRGVQGNVGEKVNYSCGANRADNSDVPWPESDVGFRFGRALWSETRVLVQAVRNISRFPSDFVFQINENEYEILRSQFEISNKREGRRYLPYAFTEQGVAMLSSVLRSKRAVQINVAIMRAFVRMRKVYENNEILAGELMKLEKECRKSGVAANPGIVK